MSPSLPIWLLVGTVVALLSFPLSAASAVYPPCFDPVAKTITIGHFPSIAHPFNLIPALGLLEDLTGWSIVWQKLDGGGRGIRQIDEGEICASWMGSAPGIYGLSRGMDMKFVGLLNIIGQAESLVGLSDIKSPKDLAGRTVGTALGSTAHYLLEILLELFEIRSTVTVVDVGSKCIEMWEGGEMQALWL